MPTKNYIRLDDDGALLYDKHLKVLDRETGRQRRLNLMIYHRFGVCFEIVYNVSWYKSGCVYRVEKRRRDAEKRVRGLLMRLKQGRAYVRGIHITDPTLKKG